MRGGASRPAVLSACHETVERLKDANESRRRQAPYLVVMGASAGGPPALASVLAALPSDFPAAVLIAQHIDARFVSHLASWLDASCSLQVRIAQHGDDLIPGTVLLAGGEDCLKLTHNARLEYTANTAKPSGAPHHVAIDVLFESVAAHWKGRLAGVLLTGMGADGAKGLKRLRQARALTIAQDRASSAIYGMPKAAADQGAAAAILPLREIVPRLVAYFKNS